MNTNLVSYYKERAKEYERIYHNPERQKELNESAQMLQDIFKDRHVLEIACGTGYWTEKISHTAASVYATDINDTVLDIAKKKTYLKAKVNFGIMNFYKIPPHILNECLFGGFIWSHIKLCELDRFLEIVETVVKPGGTVAFMDNNFVEGVSYPITSTDDEGNTFQTRKLDDGSEHLIVKNFPCESFLREKLSGRAVDICFTSFQHYWILKYRLPEQKGAAY